MKFKILIALFAFAIFGCKPAVTQADIAKVNGYWEIEKVVMPDGNTRQYSVNTTVDYFEIKGNNGLRKKVTPQINGSYRDIGPAEKITVTVDHGKTYFNYDSGYAKWKEEVIAVGDSALVFKNEAKLEYHYKKPFVFSAK